MSEKTMARKQAKDLQEPIEIPEIPWFVDEIFNQEKWKEYTKITQALQAVQSKFEFGEWDNRRTGDTLKSVMRAYIAGEWTIAKQEWTVVVINKDGHKEYVSSLEIRSHYNYPAATTTNLKAEAIMFDKKETAESIVTLIEDGEAIDLYG